MVQNATDQVTARSWSAAEILDLFAECPPRTPCAGARNRRLLSCIVLPHACRLAVLIDLANSELKLTALLPRLSCGLPCSVEGVSGGGPLAEQGVAPGSLRRRNSEHRVVSDHHPLPSQDRSRLRWLQRAG